MTTNQSNNLRPCPFCGKMPESYNDDGVNFYWCANEDCENFDQVCGICEIAWNTRPIEDELNARIAELERDKKALRGIEENLREHIDIGTRQLSVATARIAELEALVEGHDPFEDFPPKERGFDCSVMVLGKFEYEDEFTPFTNWDLCVYWFDEERWRPLNGYVKGDDIVRWYALPHEEREE